VVKDRFLPLFPCLAFDHPAIQAVQRFASDRI
jgi:hypothetical protein